MQNLNHIITKYLKAFAFHFTDLLVVQGFDLKIV